jgi:hypothetical protein
VWGGGSRLRRPSSFCPSSFFYLIYLSTFTPTKHLLLFPRHRPKALRQTIIFHYKHVNIPRCRWPVFPDGVVTNCPDEGAHDEVATAPHAPTPCSADPFESVRRGRCKPRPFQNGRPYQDVTDDRHTTDTSVALGQPCILKGGPINGVAVLSGRLA